MMSEEDHEKIAACLILFVEMNTLQKQLQEHQKKMGDFLCDVIKSNRLSKPEKSKAHLIRIK
jgi:hypothetical protein